MREEEQQLRIPGPNRSTSIPEPEHSKGLKEANGCTIDETRRRSQTEEESYVRIKRTDLERILALIERLERRIA
jgi:hypothetical protein